MNKIKYILTTIIVFAQVHAISAKTYIVCVGVRDYPGLFNDLTVSDNDAKNIANLYRNYGNAEVVCLTNRNATVANVVNAMKRLYSQAGFNDTVIFFFSGHGQTGVFKCYDRSLSYSTITNCMKLSNSKRRFVMADACMSGSMRNNKRRNHSSDVSVMFFLSSRTSEPSREVFGMRYSVFSNYLSNGLQGKADANHDRMVTAKELFDYVSTNVIKTTRRRQHPVMWGNFNDNMVVMQL